MPIIATGIDIVHVPRIARMRDEYGAHFLNRCFTPAEQEYCSRAPKRLDEHLAGRFAAKEAIMKVLGTGWSGGIAWTDMEILPDPAGRPILTLSGISAERAAVLGITRWHLSISHVEEYAVANAMGEQVDCSI